jgi:hypothetical protein
MRFKGWYCAGSRYDVGDVVRVKKFGMRLAVFKDKDGWKIFSFSK